MSYTIPKLVVTKQTSLTYGNHVKNGISQVVHTVVKQSNFNITLAFDHNELYDSRSLQRVTTISPDRPLINFYQFQIEARLYYDSEDQKEVDFVKHKPIEYKPQINENGTICNIECRLNVLTSQLEDMNFRIKFRALDPQTQNEISQLLRAISAPIKVISKPEPTKVKKAIPKKRTTSEIILDSLMNIQDTQQYITNIISSVLNDPYIASPLPGNLLSSSNNTINILHNSNNTINILNNSGNTIDPTSTSPLLPNIALNQTLPPSTNLNPNINVNNHLLLNNSNNNIMLQNSNSGNNNPTLNLSNGSNSSNNNSGGNNPTLNLSNNNNNINNNNFTAPPNAKKQKYIDCAPQDFESSFRNLMDSFLLLQQNERPTRVKDIINRIGVSSDYISELHDLFSSEGLEKSIGKTQMPSQTSDLPNLHSHADTAFECHCENCPHRLELEKIEDFYRSAFYN